LKPIFQVTFHDMLIFIFVNGVVKLKLFYMADAFQMWKVECSVLWSLANIL